MAAEQIESWSVQLQPVFITCGLMRYSVVTLSKRLLLIYLVTNFVCLNCLICIVILPSHSITAILSFIVLFYFVSLYNMHDCT